MQIEAQALNGLKRTVTVDRSSVFYRWASMAAVGDSTQRFYSAGLRKVTRIA